MPRSNGRSTLHKPTTHVGGLFDNLGVYEQKRKKLKEDRKREYNSYLEKVTWFVPAAYVECYD